MFSAHQQNYLVDAVSFALSLVPVATLVMFVLLERIERYTRSVKRRPAQRYHRPDMLPRRDDQHKKAA